MPDQLQALLPAFLANRGNIAQRRNQSSGVASMPATKTNIYDLSFTVNRPKCLLEIICILFQASQGGIILLSPEGELSDHITFGMGDADAEFRRSSWSLSVLHLILEQSSLLCLVDFAQAYPALMLPAGLPTLGPFLGLPLAFPGRCRGAFYVARSEGQPPFDRHALEAMPTVRSWLERENLCEEARLVGYLQMLNQVAQAAAGNLDLSRILRVALRELDRALPLHLCTIWLLESDGSVSRDLPSPAVGDNASVEADAAADTCLILADNSAAVGDRARSMGLVPGLRMPLAQTPFASAIHNGEALYADWTKPAERTSPLADNLSRHGAIACFAVPLHAGERTLGLLQCICLRPSGFTMEHIQTLYMVADLIGPAISNCQLFARLHGAYEELRVTQSQLVQAEKIRALGELASGMAHEFNNSLCGVIGFLELALLGQGLTPTCQGYLESARTCALDAAQVVRRVQDFARWQRNEQAVQPVDLNQLVRQTIELIRHKWENLKHTRESPITVHVECEASGTILGSPVELREVVTNLVFNGVDAMPRGGTLTLRTWSSAADLYLSVHDTGIGISDAVRQRLFEPFFTTKGERGNGLGLSVAFGIIRRHGGDIQVESDVGHGSTFTLRLPLSKNPPRNGAEPPATAFVASAATAMEESLRILVIEDEEAIRCFLGTGLSSMGHRPRLTADVQQGLTALQEEAFDVVLTDLGLPDASGEEVARAVARQSSPIPVILITGWANQIMAENTTMEGVTCILSKPVTLEKLSTTLAAVCSAT